MSHLTPTVVPEAGLSSATHMTPVTPEVAPEEESYTYKHVTSYLSAIQKMEKLNSKNWLAWKERMLYILNACHGFSYITGNIERPDPNINPTGAWRWTDMDNAISTLLVTAIGDEQMIHVPKQDIGGSVATSADIWRALKEANQVQGVIAIFLTLGDFWAKCAMEEEDLIMHLNRMKEYRVELQMMGWEIADDIFKLHILCSLPCSYAEWVNSTIGSVTELRKIPMSVGQLIMHIRNEATRRKAPYTHETDETANKATEHFRGKKWRYDTTSACAICTRTNHTMEKCYFKGKPKCGYCHKFGHTTEDCWTRKGKNSSAPKGKEKAHMTMDDMDVDDTFGITDATEASIIEKVNISDDNITDSYYVWYADSATTSHITHQKEILLDFRLEMEIINGVGAIKIYVHGRGTIILESRIMNGTRRIVLTDVFYVPTATSNLVSILRLDQSGYTSWMGNSNIRIYNN